MNVTITDPTYKELGAFFAQPSKPLSPAALAEARIVFPPPPPVIVVQPGNPPGLSGYNRVMRMTLPPWVIGAAAHTHLYTADAGGLGANDLIVVEITTPAALGTNAYGGMSWCDVGQDPRTPRAISISDQPGDFTRGLGGNKQAISVGLPTGTLWYSAGPNKVGYPAMTLPNHKYFINVKNVGGECRAATCNLDLEFIPPRA